MAMSLVFLILCLKIISYSNADMRMSVEKEMLTKKMDDKAMMDSVMAKLKRESWSHTTPCPPYWPHTHKGWQPEPKVQFIHKPAVNVVKPTYNTGWQSGWQNPWQQNSGWTKPVSAGWQSGWNSGWQSGWKQPSYQSQSNWQPKFVVQKPLHDQKPVYHVPQPDCPATPHHHTGIVYAPQHQYHQPQHIKVAKPVYLPPPVYNKPAPVYHHPAPVYHQPAPMYHPEPIYHHPVHTPQVQICDK